MTVTDETTAEPDPNLVAAIERITDDYAATAERTTNPLIGTIALLREANAEEFASAAYMAKSQEALDYAIEGLATLDPASDDAQTLAEAIAKLSRFLANDWEEFNEPKVPPVTNVNWLTSMTASGECAPCAEAAAETQTFQSTPIAIQGETDDDERIPSSARWEGPIGYENEMTGDGRFLEEGSLRWENLPIPLRYVGRDVGAHDGAEVVANIDTIERREAEEDGSIPIWGAGDFDLGSEIGREAYRQVKGGWTTGVSMDLDDVTFEVHASSDLVNEAMGGEGPAIEDMAVDEDGRIVAAKYAPDDEVSVTTDGRIRAATIVAVPAFHKARISLTASGIVYAPDQARAPEGTKIGGQWLDTPSGMMKRVRARQVNTIASTKVRARGGASMSPKTLAEPTDGYMVAVQGHNLEVPESDYFGPKGEETFTQWMEANEEALSQPGAHIGLWHDKENGEVVLDVSQRVDTLDEAVALGTERNQQAIWDVAAGAEIPTGGTGDRGETDDRASTGTDDATLRAGTRGVLRLERRGETRLDSRGHQDGRGADGGVEFATGNPRQARAPKGSTIGGRWIDTPTAMLGNTKDRKKGSPADIGGVNTPELTALSDGGSLGESVVPSQEDFAAMADNPVTGAYIVRDPETGLLDFTPERKAYHDEIVASHLQGVEPSDNPTVFMNGGGPGSGKSSMTSGVNATLTGYPSTREVDDMTGMPDFEGTPNPGAVLVDPDSIKMMLPETRAMREQQRINGTEENRSGTKDDAWANLQHEESSYLGKRTYAAALERKMDVVYDGTGDSGEKSVMKKVDAARKAGHRVEANYLYLEPSVGLGRAIKRGNKTGRVVPPSMLAHVYGDLPNTVKAVKGKFDVIRVFDNNVPQGTPAKLIGEDKGDGKGFQPYDKDAMAAFESSGSRVPEM